MNCFKCLKDTGDVGNNQAIILETNGNYGSRLMDDEKYSIRLSICDNCLKTNYGLLRQLEAIRCDECGHRSRGGLVEFDGIF